MRARPRNDFCVGFIGPEGDIRAFGYKGYDSRKTALKAAGEAALKDASCRYCVLKIVALIAQPLFKEEYQ